MLNINRGLKRDIQLIINCISLWIRCENEDMRGLAEARWEISRQCICISAKEAAIPNFPARARLAWTLEASAERWTQICVTVR